MDIITLDYLSMIFDNLDKYNVFMLKLLPVQDGYLLFIDQTKFKKFTPTFYIEKEGINILKSDRLIKEVIYYSQKQPMQNIHINFKDFYEFFDLKNIDKSDSYVYVKDIKLVKYKTLDEYW